MKTMISTSASRTFKFCAAHRLLHHPGKCKHVHGHNYKATVCVEGPKDSQTGMVIDFSWLKDAIGGWIDANWDHNIILNPDDPLRWCWEHPEVMVSHSSKSRLGNIFGDKKPYFMPPDLAEPTAENMAELLASETQIMLDRAYLGRYKVSSVYLEETDGCCAVVSLYQVAQENP